MSDWVNLQDYLALNEGAGTDMGMRVYGDVSDKASKAAQKLTNDQIGYDYAVKGGTAQGPNGDASQYSQEEAEKNAANREYTGPTSLADYDPSLAGTVQDASQQVQAASDPSQRGSVIQETFGAQSATGVGGSALDNFLVGGTAGGQQLAQLGNQYKGLLDSLGLAEDDAYAKGQAAATTTDANAKKWGDMAKSIADEKNKPPETAAGAVSGYKDYRSFMDSGSAGQYAHEAAMYASPADWATRGLGELGYDGENVSQLFSKMFGANGNQSGGTGDWSVGNLRSAARLVQDQYGDKAMEAWFKGLTPEAWKNYMNKGNAGAQARYMRAWLQEHGYNKIRG